MTVPSSKPKQNAEIISNVGLGVIMPMLYESTLVHSGGKLSMGSKKASDANVHTIAIK